MNLDLLQLFFGLLILCSLEHSFRQAAREKDRSRVGFLDEEAEKLANKTNRKPVAVINPRQVSSAAKSIHLVDDMKTPKRRRRANSLPVYRSKELEDALNEVRSS